MTPQEIKNLRSELKLTQQELAYILKTTPVTVSRWERGESKPSKIFISEMKKLLKEA